MKTKFLLSLLLIVSSASAFSQILAPVKWSYAAKKTGPGTATLYLKASIGDGWHLYSQFIKEGGPVKTSFTFTPSKDYARVGGVIEPKAITRYENTFKMNVSYFEKAVIFQQKVILKSKNPVIKGKLEFMVCDDKQCLPPEEVDFSIMVK